MTPLVLFGKLGISILGGAAAIGLVPWTGVYRARDWAFTAAATTGLALSRVMLFVLLFLIGGFRAESDVVSYYEWTHTIMSGGLPLRDIPAAYGPLFHYLLAVPLLIWDSPKSLILFAILTEIIAFPTWLAVARRWFSESMVRTAAILYITSPVCLLNVALLGQNQVAISLMLAASLLLLSTDRSFISGALLGASIAAVKYLSVVYAPALLPFAKRRAAWLVGLVLLPSLSYGVLAARGVDLFGALTVHAGDHSSGNLPFLCSAFGANFFSPTFGRISNVVGLVLLTTLVLTTWCLLDSQDRSRTVSFCALILFAVLLLSKKSFTTYLVTAFFPICLVVATRRPRWPSVTVFSVFNVLAAIEPSLWYRWLPGHDLRLLWQTKLPEGTPRPAVFLFALVELCLISFYLWYGFLAWKQTTGYPGWPAFPSAVKVAGNSALSGSS